ncbi:hypothetical protein BDV38DRAFT_234259 [Aspergillus pseudotamarii]|uniref:Fluoroacetyl-CoA-specific thioesterase-like domain-containing protein n=1 Tax=Aspergillus pseudotamarii TaxID=132259 RepID=A0A5N6T9A2_ASPPS|nr:uncharacterized protein BDV38DRAFT_234259 [Aspergillus pseudotamarii]KAE8142925.1 hypothetical protein BDV38DRAFT_234259 [Aspergillus pseudotamarii]
MFLALWLGHLSRAHIRSESRLSNLQTEGPPLEVCLGQPLAARLMQPSLSPEQLPVGTSINIIRSAPKPLQAKVTAEAKFLGQKGKIYQSEVTVRDEVAEIGRGTHESAIVDVARLENGAKKRGSTVEC